MRLPEFRPMTCRLFALLLATTLISACGINNIPTYDEAVNEHWAALFKQYQQRIELVPDLLRSVNEFTQQEEDTRVQVIDNLERVMQINVSPEMLENPETLLQYQKHQDALTLALQKLITMSKSHPILKSDEEFLSLRQRQEETENRIAVARRNYIGVVQRYNTELRTIPGRWWASFMYSDMRPKANITSVTPW